MAEKTIKELLAERGPEQCNCTPLKVANFAIASAAERSGANFDQAAKVHESIIDRDCPGLVKRDNVADREGCQPEYECGHKNGPAYLNDATQVVDFYSL